MRGVAAVFAVFAAGHWLSVFFRTANAVIANDLTREMALSPNQLGLMTSLYFLTFAGAQLPLGAALDRFGARRVTAVTMLFGVAGALVFASARSFEWLAVGRALLGLGTAAGLMGGLKALSSWFEARRFAAVSGALVAVGSSGALMAAAPLAWLERTAGWRSVFGFGAATFALCALLIYALGRDGPYAAGAGSGRRQGGFADVFRNPGFWLLALLGFSISGSIIAHQTLWAGPYLTDGIGLEELTAGTILTALAVGTIAGFFASGVLAARLGLRRVLIAAVALFALVQLLLGLAPRDVVTLTLLLTSFGFLSSFMILLLAEARALFPLELTGRAVTAVNLFFFAGGFLLQWVLGPVVERYPVEADGGYSAAAYGSGFLVTAGVCLLALTVYLLRPRPASN